MIRLITPKEVQATEHISISQRETLSNLRDEIEEMAPSGRSMFRYLAIKHPVALGLPAVSGLLRELHRSDLFKGGITGHIKCSQGIDIDLYTVQQGAQYEGRIKIGMYGVTLGFSLSLPNLNSVVLWAETNGLNPVKFIEDCELNYMKAKFGFPSVETTSSRIHEFYEQDKICPTIYRIHTGYEEAKYSVTFGEKEHRLIITTLVPMAIDAFLSDAGAICGWVPNKR